MIYIISTHVFFFLIPLSLPSLAGLAAALLPAGLLAGLAAAAAAANSLKSISTASLLRDLK